MTRARDLADSADKDITGTLTLDGLTVAGNVSVDSGTIKLDGNYPTGSNNVALGDQALDDGSLSGSNIRAMLSATSNFSFICADPDVLNIASTSKSGVAVVHSPACSAICFTAPSDMM